MFRRWEHQTPLRRLLHRPRSVFPFAWLKRRQTNVSEELRSQPSLFSYLLEKRLIILPMQLAMCTKGPSLPSDSPEATDSARPTDFVNKVRPPRYPWITKPGTSVS